MLFLSGESGKPWGNIAFDIDLKKKLRVRHLQRKRSYANIREQVGQSQEI